MINITWNTIKIGGGTQENQSDHKRGQSPIHSTFPPPHPAPTHSPQTIMKTLWFLLFARVKLWCQVEKLVGNLYPIQRKIVVVAKGYWEKLVEKQSEHLDAFKVLQRWQKGNSLENRIQGKSQTFILGEIRAKGEKSCIFLLVFLFGAGLQMSVCLRFLQLFASLTR